MSDNGNRVRAMTREDLALVYAWRNHPDVRQYMYTRHEISLEEHSRWFEKASNDPSRSLLIFEHQDIPRGFAQFSRLPGGKSADWGFYLAFDAPKGSGRALGACALSYAFFNLDLHKVCGQVLANNERSIALHLRLGFQKEGLLRDHFFDGKNFQAVVCFGLLKAEWRPFMQTL